jgi:hypothetical protein
MGQKLRKGEPINRGSKEELVHTKKKAKALHKKLTALRESASKLFVDHHIPTTL